MSDVVLQAKVFQFCFTYFKTVLKYLLWECRTAPSRYQLIVDEFFILVQCLCALIRMIRCVDVDHTGKLDVDGP